MDGMVSRAVGLTCSPTMRPRSCGSCRRASTRRARSPWRPLLWGAVLLIVGALLGWGIPALVASLPVPLSAEQRAQRATFVEQYEHRIDVSSLFLARERGEIRLWSAQSADGTQDCVGLDAHGRFALECAPSDLAENFGVWALLRIDPTEDGTNMVQGGRISSALDEPVFLLSTMRGQSADWLLQFAPSDRPQAQALVDDGFDEASPRKLG